MTAKSDGHSREPSGELAPSFAPADPPAPPGRPGARPGLREDPIGRALALATLLLGVQSVLWVGSAFAQTDPFATTVTQGSSAYNALVQIARLFIGGIGIFAAIGAAVGRFPKTYALGGLVAVLIVSLAPMLVNWVWSWGGGNTAATILGS